MCRSLRIAVLLAIAVKIHDVATATARENGRGVASAPASVRFRDTQCVDIAPPCIGAVLTLLQCAAVLVRIAELPQLLWIGTRWGPLPQ